MTPRNRTLAADLDFLLRVIEPVGTEAVPARIELTRSGGVVLAQVMGDRLAVPLVAEGPDVRSAVRVLRDETERVASQRRRRKRT